MRTATVLVGVLSCAVLAIPQTASAAGNYGAVVERGVRDCRTAPGGGRVICFEAPSVSPESRDLFLQAWRAAPFTVARGDVGAPMLRVRAVSLPTARAPFGTATPTYLAQGDEVTPDSVCLDVFRLRAWRRLVRLESMTSSCDP